MLGRLRTRSPGPHVRCVGGRDLRPDVSRSLRLPWVEALPPGIGRLRTPAFGSPLCQWVASSRLSMVRRSSPPSSKLRLTAAAGRRWDRASGTGRRVVWAGGNCGRSLGTGGSGKWLIRSVDVRGQVDRAGFLSRPEVPSRGRLAPSLQRPSEFASLDYGTIRLALNSAVTCFLIVA
jgi:hypothetical protein